MTSILCTITPAPMHREETVSTLKFGQLCKTIKNTVKSNEVIDDRMLIKQYKATIQELRLQVNKLEGENNDVVVFYFYYLIRFIFAHLRTCKFVLIFQK